MKRINATLLLGAALAASGMSLLHAQAPATVGINTGENLAFTSATAGSQSEPIGFSSFTCVYSASDAYTCALPVQLKSNKWDDCFTDGSHGSFVRQQYRKGVSFDTDSDTFTVTTP